MSIRTWIVTLILFAAAFGGFAAGGPGKKEPFYYRTQSVANARANAAKYGWAKAIFDKKTGDARIWLGWSDERLLHYVPEVTPMRPSECPNCGKSWVDYIWEWSPDKPDEVVCRFCRKATSSTLFPDCDVFICKDPQGVDQRLPFYRNGVGKPIFIRSVLAYHQFLHAASMAVTLAEAFVLTGEEPFARKSLLLLRRMGEVYPGYVLKDWTGPRQELRFLGTKPWGLAGKLSGWHYEDAIAVGSLARAYDAIRCAGLVSPADARAIEEGLFRKAGELLIGVPPASGCVNDIPHRFAGVASISRVLGDEVMMRWVLNDRDGFGSFVQSNWLPDGHWIERSPGYDLMALSLFHLTPMVLQGYRPTGALDALDLRRIPLIRKINSALFGIVWPDGTLPAMSDSRFGLRPSGTLAEINFAWYGGRENLEFLLKAEDGRLLEKGDEFAFWNRDPGMDRRIRNLRSSDFPVLRSVHLPHLGITMMRSRGADPEVLLFDHGEWANDHCHFDRLGITLWTLGREMASDLGYIYWGHPQREPWAIQTLAHNTVVVDGESQDKPGKARPVFVRLGDRVQVVEAEAPAAYSGKVSEFRRTVAQVPQESGPPFVVDVFRVRGGTVHDWSYHVEAGPPEVAGVTLGEGIELGGEIPYTQLSDVRSGTTDGGWTATWRWPDDAGVRLWMCASPGTQVNSVMAPGQRRREDEGKRMPYLIVRRSGHDLASTFVCVHEPFRRNSRIRSVTLLTADADRAGWPVLLKVEAGGKSWRVASKLSEGPWQGIPPSMPRPEAGRFSVRAD
jgi:hypothetical protein